MSRLEEYLKTPTPRYHEFLTPNSQEQEQNSIMFSPQSGSVPHPAPNELQYISSLLGQWTLSMPPEPASKLINMKLHFKEVVCEHIWTTTRQKKEKHPGVTTAQKKQYVRSVESLLPDYQEVIKGNMENERTLKSLAVEAYNIVQSKISTTYKQVSGIIINGCLDMPNAEVQKNIKRRVYDSLNVLISLGKLEKKGRRIEISNKEILEVSPLRQKLLHFRECLRKKEFLVAKKRRLFKLGENNKEKLKKLMQRNMRLQAGIPSVRMPFILASDGECVSFDPTSHVQVAMGKTVMGDIDALEFLKIS